MSGSADILRILEPLREQVKPLLAEIKALERDLKNALSREWIAANNVKREDIVTPDDKGMPYFGHVKSFADHLAKTNCTKKWAAWNGTIYSTSEIIRGYMDYENSPGKTEHVQ